MADRKQGKPMNLEIQADDQTAMGQYINMAIVQHSSSEFVLDFIFIAPGQKARLRSRSILAPEHANSAPGAYSRPSTPRGFLKRCRRTYRSTRNASARSRCRKPSLE